MILGEKWQNFDCVREALVKRYTDDMSEEEKPKLDVDGAAGDRLYVALEALRFSIRCQVVFYLGDELYWSEMPGQWSRVSKGVDHLSLRVPHQLLLNIHGDTQRPDEFDKTLPSLWSPPSSMDQDQNFRAPTSRQENPLQYLELVIYSCQFDTYTTHTTIEIFTKKLVSHLNLIGGEGCRYFFSVYDTEEGYTDRKGEFNALVGTTMLDVWKRMLVQEGDTGSKVVCEPTWSIPGWRRIENLPP